MKDATVTADRSLEILHAIAAYHGIRAGNLIELVCTSEQHTIRAFYKHFPQCSCPTNAILLCIIEDLKEPCTAKPR